MDDARKTRGGSLKIGETIEYQKQDFQDKSETSEMKTGLS